MKTNMMKMTAAAALVLGMAGVAHAAGTPASKIGASANIQLGASVTDTTCDVVLNGSSDVNLGSILADELNQLTVDSGIGNSGNGNTTSVKLMNCGEPNAAGNSRLIFSAMAAGDSPLSQTHRAWGEPGKSVGYGFMITATPDGGNKSSNVDLDFTNNVLLLDDASTSDTSALLNGLSATIAPYVVKTATAVTAGTSLSVPMTISYTHD